jgi:hypothetical protein
MGFHVKHPPLNEFLGPSGPYPFKNNIKNKGEFALLLHKAVRKSYADIITWVHSFS